MSNGLHNVQPTGMGGAQVPTMGIQRPVQPESTVKPIEINVPDFLKNAKR